MHSPEKPEKVRRRAIWALVPAAVLGGGLLWQARSDTPSKPAGVAGVAVKTTVVRAGGLERTLRLTGSTAPERFAQMLAPRMRGRRGGGGGGFSSGSSSGSSASSTSSSSSSSSSSGSKSTTSSGSSQLATALNRFSTVTSSSASTASSSSTSTSTSSSSSTSSGGSGGGGGGMGGFELTLQNCVPGGKRVKKGDVIAEFDRQNMLLRLDDFKASIDQQAAGLNSLKANLDLDKKAHEQSISTAKSNLDKARYDLKTIPVQSAIVSEQLRLAEQEAAATHKDLQSQVRSKAISRAAQWRISEIDLEQNRGEYQRAQANADKMLFKAPIDGLVVMGTTFRGSEFSQIRAGDQVNPGTMFMQVVDPSSMVVNATVNQTDIEMLRVGARAKVRFDAYPDLELPARLYSIAAMPKSGGARAAYVKEVPVVLKLEKLDPRVVPDLSVSVDVVVESAPEGVVAPREAIFTDAGNPQPYALVRTADGWERRPVELGVKNHVAVIVRSGLRAGERIASERPAMEQKRK